MLRGHRPKTEQQTAFRFTRDQIDTDFEQFKQAAKDTSVQVLRTWRISTNG